MFRCLDLTLNHVVSGDDVLGFCWGKNIAYSLLGQQLDACSTFEGLWIELEGVCSVWSAHRNGVQAFGLASTHTGHQLRSEW